MSQSITQLHFIIITFFFYKDKISSFTGVKMFNVIFIYKIKKNNNKIFYFSCFYIIL